MSELPDGAAKELFESADDPFTVRDAAGPSGPGVNRVIDEFVVDVLRSYYLTPNQLAPAKRQLAIGPCFIRCVIVLHRGRSMAVVITST